MKNSKTTAGTGKVSERTSGITGRPSTFTAAIFDEIVARVSEGEPLAQICREEKMPGLMTVYDWMQKDCALSVRFASARVAGYDIIAADALRIADTPIEGTESEEDGGGKITKRRRRDMIEHRRLQVDTRLKLLAKWDPKRYGDRLVHTGDADSDAIKVDLGGAKAALLAGIKTRG